MTVNYTIRRTIQSETNGLDIQLITSIQSRHVIIGGPITIINKYNVIVYKDYRDRPINNEKHDAMIT